jgi:hypothetical protein
MITSLILKIPSPTLRRQSILIGLIAGPLVGQAPGARMISVETITPSGAAGY